MTAQTQASESQIKWWLLGVALAFSVLVLPPIFAGLDTILQHGDMVRFHLPQINVFIADPFQLLRYKATSATTPGHHILFAWVAILLGYDHASEQDLPLRLLNVALALGFLLTAWLLFWRLSRDSMLATVCVAPLIASNYVATAAIWINTDNGALLFYALAMHALVFTWRGPWPSVWLLLMVMWRQIYTPVVGAFALGMLARRSEESFMRLSFRAIAVCLPAIVAVTAYAVVWGGLTPGGTQLYNKAVLNPAVPLHALALTGLLAAPFGLLLAPTFQALDGQGSRMAWLGGLLVASVIWIVGPSDYDNESGRWGSLVWVIAKSTPAVGGHSIAVLVLAWMGAATLIAIGWRAWMLKRYPGALIMLLGYFVGYSAQVFAWQRYIEPAILLCLGVQAAENRGKSVRLANCGPLLLAVAFAAASQLRIWGAVGRMFG